MEFDTSYDLIVVGGGASGNSAALIAAREGKSVVILEKMPELGGLSVFAEGTAAFESSEQKRLGKPDHPDRHFPSKAEGYAKFNSFSHYRANYEVVKAFVDNSAETIDIYKDLGIEYKTVTIAAYDDPNEIWTFHLPDGLGARCQEVLIEAIERAGVDIFTNTPVKELIIEDGKVVGVVAHSEGEEPIRVGGKAVILATGGMGSSPDLIAKYSWFSPSAYNMNVLTPLQNVGDGLRMALDAGADPDNITTCPLLAGGARDKAMDSEVGAAGIQPGTIWVNKTGRRFISEGIAENIGDIGPQYGKQPDGIVWSLLDQDNIDRLIEVGSEVSIGEFVVFGRPLKRLKTELTQDVEDGVVKKADTVEELARLIDVDEKTLIETVSSYNDACKTGRDEYYLKQEKFLRPLSKTPFYAIALATGTMGSAGGIRINGNMQVVNKEYEPIEGLYAVGLDATGLYGDSYNMEVPGAANGFAHTSGRIAARHAISELGK